MEKTPSLALRDNPSPLQGAAPPSLVQRTVRALLAPALLGGALAVGAAPSADVAAQNPVKEERKEEDPLLAQLRQEIPSLIADLDSEKYQVREKAQRRLEQIALGWVREKQQVFPLIASLAPKGGYSLEQQRRLGRIIAAHEGMELQLLWRPTIFREPPEWKERKNPPTVREVLAALEKQTGQKISLDGQGIAEGLVADKLDGRTFWEALEQAGKKCMVYRARDGSLSLWADEHCVRAASGNVLGQAHVWHCHPFDQTRQIGVQFLMEPLLLPGGAFITKADGITDKGRKVACGVDEWGSVTLPFEEGEQSIDLTVKACLRGYERRVEKVEPHSIELTLPGRMTTAEKTLTFKGIPLQ